MDEAEVRSKIDKILAFHRKGLRDIEQTVTNLNNLCTTLDPAVQDRVFGYLFSVLVQHLSLEPLPKTDARVSDPSIIRVIMRAISQFGPAPKMFAQLFAYLDSDNARVTRNWGDDVFPELVLAIYSQPDRLPQGALNEIKANTVLHSTQLRRNLIRGGPVPSYVSGAANLERAIEDLEFKRFEKALSHEASAAVANRQQIRQPPDAGEQLETYLNDLNLDPSIGKAMTEARNYLSTQGAFDPKKAADLIRSSMEQMNRGIVGALTKLTCEAFAGKGLRRRPQAVHERGGIHHLGGREVLQCCIRTNFKGGRPQSRRPQRDRSCARTDDLRLPASSRPQTIGS